MPNENESEGTTTLEAIELEPYWTIFIPSVPMALRTEWHPTEREGAFKTLTRGAFKTEEQAIEWGRKHLAGLPYTIKLITD